jgi:hypothetical protein
VDVLRVVGGYLLLLLFTATGWALVSDYRGVRRWQVLKSLGFADPEQPHPSWQPVPQPSHERMIRRQDRVAGLVGWTFLLTGGFFAVVLSAELIF